MTLLPSGIKVHLAVDLIDMRKGIDGLAMLVQGVLRLDPFAGHLFVFRGRKPISSRLSIGMAPDCVCSPSGLNKAHSRGRRLLKQTAP